MSHFPSYQFSTSPVARKESVIQGAQYRFTVLTPQMIRMEFSGDGRFTDLATKTVINRDFPSPSFRIVEEDDQLEIITEGVHLVYNKKEFSKNGLSVSVKGNLSAYHSTWHYGDSSNNLKGTARTLDESDGAIPLEDGILSRNGFAIIDDSSSMLLTEDGWVAPREKGAVDLYFLGYGRAYLGCLKDFYHLCGKTPMLPRYAFGNWWSRFHSYTEEEYMELVNRFEEEQLPFSVAVIDMGWHLTEQDMDPKYGSGWTGYTWNRKYFPDPKRFMGWLHEKNMHVTLNVHPAEGVRGHEAAYLSMAKELGVDNENEDKIPFDASNQAFFEAYFKYLHHPNEEDGVDFWWIDWQQAGGSRLEGLDPLWMLNHYHYLDNGRDGKRPMTFSRYAGLGSHRYSVGFSGDTFTTWDTLDFQPYFTATASNAGYGYWSHDIGGHMHGIKNDEMLVRWIQFGVFSPIMRMHSSDNPFFVKEPWAFNPLIQNVMKNFLRLRHQLIPYLYSMNYFFSIYGEPVIQPMYYKNPEQEEAYEVPNEYYFGTELIACPITRPVDERVNMGVFKGWLPEGSYYDIFNGRRYRGNRRMKFYRDITSMPVFARAGAILPMEQETAVKNSTENPVDLEIRVFAGADGAFVLYEDDSLHKKDMDIHSVKTHFTWKWSQQAEFTVWAETVENSVIPEERNYIFRFYGMKMTQGISASLDGEQVPFKTGYDERRQVLTLSLARTVTKKRLVISFDDAQPTEGNLVGEDVFEMLNHAQIEYDLKDLIYRVVTKGSPIDSILSELQALGLEEALLGALFELLTA